MCHEHTAGGGVIDRRNPPTIHRCRDAAAAQRNERDVIVCIHIIFFSECETLSRFVNHCAVWDHQRDSAGAADSIPVAFNLLERVLEHGREAEGVELDVLGNNVPRKANNPSRKKKVEGGKYQSTCIAWSS